MQSVLQALGFETSTMAIYVVLVVILFIYIYRCAYIYFFNPCTSMFSFCLGGDTSSHFCKKLAIKGSLKQTMCFIFLSKLGGFISMENWDISLIPAAWPFILQSFRICRSEGWIFLSYYYRLYNLSVLNLRI